MDKSTLTYFSVGVDEINKRFGAHKGTIEGPNATAPRHADLRQEFIAFAMHLDAILPPGRAKAVALAELESCSIWAHKGIAELAPADTQLEVEFRE